MTLRQLIPQYGLSGTPQEIAEQLNAKTVPVANSQLYTSTGIIMELGPDLARQALAGLEAAMQHDPLLRAQYDKLNSTGIDFSHPLTQQFIEQLCQQGFITRHVADALKQIGIKYKSLAETVFGDGVVITAEDVQKALEPPAITGRRVTVMYNESDQNAFGSLVIELLSDSDVVERRVFSYRHDRGADDSSVNTFFQKLHDEIRVIIDQIQD